MNTQTTTYATASTSTNESFLQSQSTFNKVKKHVRDNLVSYGVVTVAIVSLFFGLRYWKRSRTNTGK